jgi:putative ABC transport system permease protein
MAPHNDAPILKLAARLYRILLLLLPRSMRRRHGESMVQTFRDVYRGEYDRGGYPALAAVWWRAVVQTVSVGVAERFGRLGRSRDARSGSAAGRSSSMADRLGQDIRFAARSLLRRPGFSLTAVAILGLGIGATAAIFSVVDGVVLKRLPYPDPERLLYLDHGSHTVPDFQMWRERAGSFERIVAVWPRQMDMLGEGAPTRVGVAGVTAGYFDVLGMRPFRGRLLQDADSHGPEQVVVLAYSFWMTRLGGEESIVGRSLLLDNASYQVVGIAPPGFRPPRRLSRMDVDMWRPEDLSLAELQIETRYMLSVFGRLREGARIETAQAEVDAVIAAMAERYPEQYESWHRVVPVITLHAAEISEAREPVLMLFGAVGLMLMIACANVANLFLARSTDREREIAVRSALGASRTRIAVQLLTESVSLALVGGFVGIAVAYAGVQALIQAAPSGTPRLHEIALDYRVLGFALGAAVLTGILFGLAPALYAARADAIRGLRDASSRTSPGRMRVKLKRALVVGEIAVALVLLVGAGLLFNSFVRLTMVEPGFDPQHVLAIELDLSSLFESDAERVQFMRDVVDRTRAVPGVQQTAAGWVIPFGGNGRCCWMTNAAAGEASDSTRVVVHAVSPGYFAALGVALVQGRDFDWQDDENEPAAAIVTRALAARLFQDQSALGRTFTIGRRSATALRVVGVVDDFKFWSLSRDEDLDMFLPFEGFGADIPFITLAVRAGGELEGLGGQLREAIWSVESRLPIPQVLSLDSQVSQSIAEPRLLSILLLAFAGFAILLAAGGIYGTMLYSVTQRTQELGIRLALGASSGRIVRHVLAGGVVVAVVGLALGLAGSYAASQVLASQVFGISPHDLPTYLAVTLLLGFIALIACYIPARRITSLDPAMTLRDE